MIQTGLIRNKIKALRLENHLSTLEIADKLNMDERNYKRIESGERKTLDLELVDRIAAIYDKEVTDLINTENININADHNSVAGLLNKDLNIQYSNDILLNAIVNSLDMQKDALETWKIFITTQQDIMINLLKILKQPMP